MTSEYEDLLARLDEWYGAAACDAHDAAAAIRALTAQVVELENALSTARTARSEHFEKLLRAERNAEENNASRIEWSERAVEVETQVVERDAVIEQVRKWNRNPRLPIAEDCDRLDTILNQAPRDALAARDAVRDRTVRATALRDAAEDVYAEPGIWDKGYAPWLRARADQEEL